MRRIMALCGALLALVIAVPVLASGFGGDSPPARIPIPAKDFRAVIEDVSGTRVALDRVTFNGEVFVYGRLGEGQASIDFDRIAFVEVLPKPGDDDRVLAKATTRDGSEVTVEIDEEVLLYGKAVFGNYQVEIGKVRRLEIVQ